MVTVVDAEPYVHTIYVFSCNTQHVQYTYQVKNIRVVQTRNNLIYVLYNV